MMIPKRKNRFRIRLLIIILLIVWMIYGFYRILSKSDYRLVFSLSAPTEYLNLFDSTAGSRLVLNRSWTSKGRQTFSEFIYEGRLSVVVWQLNLAKEGVLKDFLHIKNESVSRSGNVVYSGLKMPTYNLSFAKDSVGPVRDVFLTLGGEAVNEIVNTDSLVGYTFRMDNFSIRYQAGAAKDVYAEKRNAFSAKVPAELLFKKQGSRLFELIITDPNQDGPIDPDLARKLLKG